MDDNILEEWKKLSLDAYWAKIQILQNICGKPKYNTLVELMMCTLTLPHGNADIERSLLENKKVLNERKGFALYNNIDWNSASARCSEDIR